MVVEQTWNPETEALRMRLHDHRENGFETSLLRLNEFYILRSYLQRIKHLAEQYGPEAPERTVAHVTGLCSDALTLTARVPVCPQVRKTLLHSLGRAAEGPD